LIECIQIDDNLAMFRFEKTPLMSTYLVAFVVGEYDYIEANDSNGVLMRVYTPLGRKEQGRFALDVNFKIILILYRVVNIMN